MDNATKPFEASGDNPETETADKLSSIQLETDYNARTKVDSPLISFTTQEARGLSSGVPRILTNTSQSSAESPPPTLNPEKKVNI